MSSIQQPPKTSYYSGLNSIHPFSIPISSVQGRRGGGTYFQWSRGERQGTPWIGRKSIAEQHKGTQDKQPCTHQLERRLWLSSLSLRESIPQNCGIDSSFLLPYVDVPQCKALNLKLPVYECECDWVNLVLV
ncbi:hypothetical protein ATANTOWER_008879 [Ataeniobius toweri]|uniref:Uncharacterized protein n=1 Tax=Ataeniobius toweri TaxID=208326 RepID=A0ABU7C782_9TELE|nr:hypothetical protein [Ataeniobius toweri]